MTRTQLSSLIEKHTAILTKYTAALEMVAAKLTAVPNDPDAELWRQIVQCLQKQPTAAERGEILAGRQFRNDGYLRFRSADLLKLLEEGGAAYPSERHIAKLLRLHGGLYNAYRVMNDRVIKLWTIASKEVLDVP
jgi:hypothetical protein